MKAIVTLTLTTFGVILAALAGCQSMSDVRPGDGRKATITGHSYDEIWTAALKVADQHFELREQDKAKGVITAERTWTAFGWGGWIGIYVVPSCPSYEPESSKLSTEPKQLQ